MLINSSVTVHHFVSEDILYLVTAFTLCALSFLLFHFVGLVLPLYRSFAQMKSVCVSSAVGSNEGVKCSYCT